MRESTASPAVALDAAVVATGRSGDADVREHLAAMSHVDSEQNPLEYARVWQLVHEADAMTAEARP